MLRAAPRMLRAPLGFLESVAERYGPVAQFPIPGRPVYLVTGPAGVQRVLAGNARAYGKATVQYESLALVTGEGLLAADTDTWRQHRRVVQPAFHQEAVGAVAGHVADAVDRLDRRWAGARGSVRDVEPDLLDLAIEVVGGALFGADLSPRSRELAAATTAALERVVARARSPLPRRTPGRRLTRARATLDDAVAGLVAARQSRPRPTEEGADLLDLLLASSLTPAEVRDEVVTFVVAGHETIASALTWGSGLLAAAPDVAARLRTEARSVLPDREQAVTLADAARLPYARAVLDEALRLYPPAWVITRRALSGDVLEGHEVPAGAMVILSPWVSHRAAAHWPEPQAFRPDRFLGGARPAAGTYLPFGAGPRQCIGRDLALLEGTLALAALARRYSLRATGPLPAPRAQVALRPHHGMQLGIAPLP